MNYFCDLHSFIEFEKSLMYAIETGDVEEITDRLNPLALTKCKNNTLYMAMKVLVKNSSGKSSGMLNR